MKRIDLLSPALAMLCVLAAGACDNPKVNEQTRQAGEAIKTAGKETGEAVKAAGQEAVDETKAAVEQAGQKVSASAKQAGKDITAAAERAGDSAKKNLAEVGDTAKKKIAEAGESAKKNIADASLTASIKAQLIANKNVKAVSIDVDTVGGKVTLRGTAKTAAQKDEAARIARETDGVVSVDNQIVVSPG